MADIRLLERTLEENVTWNRARINFLAKFLVALIEVKTVNLTEVASVFAGRAQRESHYKRIQRFLRFFELPYQSVARLVVRLVGMPAPWVLTLDRTDWYFGQTPINIMVLGIAYKGAAFPVLWRVLEKKGCSASAERIALLAEFGQLFGFASIRHLCADREFIGKDWFAYLCAAKINFRIRVRANTQLSSARGKPTAARRLFANKRVAEVVRLTGARKLWGQSLAVEGMRLSSGDLLVVVAPHESAQLIREYGVRWEIETLFGCLKTRGFCLEQTHVTDPHRLKKLVALLSICFCWAHLVGEWLSRQQPLKVKKHGRLARSIFRHGFDHLRRILCGDLCNSERFAFRQVIKLLSCT
jgi:Transposase DDE domain